MPFKTILITVSKSISFLCFPCRHPYNTSNSERNVKNVNFDVFFVIFDVDPIILKVNKAAAR